MNAVGAQLFGGPPVLRLALGGEDQHRQVVRERVVGADLLQHLEPRSLAAA